jgi:phosphate ABC transporter permease protein PstC
VEASATTAGGGRSAFERSPFSRLPDQLTQWGLSGLAVILLLLIAYFFVRLIGKSEMAFSHFGLSFIFGNDWNPAANGNIGVFHALPLVVGTLVTSVIALLIGVPVAVATALFLTELCPRRARGPIGMLVDLLAAVPSVVYGLWGVFVLAPKLQGFEKWIANTFSFIPYIGGNANAVNASGNYFIAGLILAIMILPIVSAIAREVLRTVPQENKEAALALGATRWEMIRMAVLPYARPGITGGAMLGLGRAIGETIAVVLVIGDNDNLGKHIFEQGYTLAAVIANEFGEAANQPLHSSALFAAGLVLFVLTLLVNIGARWFVNRGTRGNRAAGTGGAAQLADVATAAAPGPA